MDNFAGFIRYLVQSANPKKRRESRIIHLYLLSITQLVAPPAIRIVETFTLF